MNIEANNKLEVLNYLILVEEIAKGFFNEETMAYQPHIGKLNAMRLYYNNCVVEGECTEKYGTEINDVDTLSEIIENTNFVKVFNNALIDSLEDECSHEFSFETAYWDAFNIVEYKKSSIGTIC